jgi:predicted transcriptional regulator
MVLQSLKGCMLNKLFGSNSRVKILKLFLTNPNEKYYIRQIARDLKLQINSVRRELENLEKFGLLVSNPSEAGEGEEALSREEFIKLGKDKAK